MIRNLKALGLALFAIFAMGALAASAASAQEKGYLTADGPVTLTAVETVGEDPNRLTAFGLGVECPGTTYTGHKLNVTPHELIPSGETQATITPHYPQTVGGKINCRVTGVNFPATVTMNGCDYVAHIGNTTPAGNKNGTYAITFDIICPTGKEITVEVFTTEAEDPSTPFCTLHVKEQKGLAGAHITDTKNGHVDIAGTIGNIHVSRTNHGAHGLLCPNNTTTNAAVFDIDITVSGHDELGDPTDIEITEGV